MGAVVVVRVPPQGAALIESSAWLVVSGVGKRGPHGNHPGDHPGENRLPPGNPRDFILWTLK